MNDQIADSDRRMIFHIYVTVFIKNIVTNFLPIMVEKIK